VVVVVVGPAAQQEPIGASTMQVEHSCRVPGRVTV
jgi:hypothetical protein